jgi:hypothetical protein
MSGGESEYDDWELYPNSIRTDKEKDGATEGTLGIPIPTPLVPRGYIKLHQWIERAKRAAKKARDDSESEGRAEAACREALSEGEVTSQLLTLDGDRLPVRINRWRGEVFWDYACLGNLTVELEAGKWTQGFLIVEEAGSASILGRLEAHGAQPTSDWTPELSLMVRAVAEMPIKRGDRTITKVSIADWFEKNAPPGLKISKTLREQMAAILMSPELRRGGQRSQKQHRELRSRGL